MNWCGWPMWLSKTAIFLSKFRWDVPVLTQGPYEILRHFHGGHHFPQEQCVRLETPGWPIFDFEAGPVSTDELCCHRNETLMTSLVKRDRDCVFTEDFLVDYSYAVNPSLLVLAGVSSTMEIFRFTDQYGLVETLLAVHLTASLVGSEVGWLREEILLSSGNCT